MNSVQWCIVIGCVVALVVSVGMSITLRRVRYWHQLVIGNGKICQEHKQLLNRIELTTFQVREHVLWMHDMHKNTLTVISQLEPQTPEQLDSLQRVQAVLQESINTIDDNFYHTFKTTPEQYRQDRLHLNYKSRTNGKDVEWRDNFGIN